MEVPGTSLLSCRGIMRTSIYLMTGLAFTFGMIVGLLVRLPVVAGPGRAASLVQSRSVRSLVHEGGLTDNYLADSVLKDGEFDYIVNNRRKELGSTGEEIASAISLNSGLIRHRDNGIYDNTILGAGDMGKHMDDRTVNNFEKLKLPRGLSGNPQAKLAPGKQELPLGESVLENQVRYRGSPPGSQSVVANLKSNDQKMKDYPEGSHSNGDPIPHHASGADQKTLDSISHPQTLEDKFNRLSELIQGIQWSGKLENLCPSGFSDSMVSSWKKQVAEGKIVHLQDGCGRMQNRLLTLQDSSKACARYRPNADQIQGEIFSYHLGKILGMENIPPTTLAMVQSIDSKWEHVNQEIAMSQWADDKLVVLTKWIENLEPAYIPSEFREDTRQLVPSDRKLLNKSLSELCELVQWSDLIVFDYLTANLDRIVNNMFNQQWNSQMMKSPAHNLERDRNTGRLVFLDNESGLLHGYRLLDKYAPYHDSLLESVCVFRKSTLDAVEKLFLEDNIGAVLEQSVVLNEKYHHELPSYPTHNVKTLNQRLSKVYDKMQRCKLQYGDR